MQWSRFVIAAVFFVLGAGIAIPALLRSNNTPSQASSAPTSSAPATGEPRTPAGTLSPARNGTSTPVPTTTPAATPTRTGAGRGPVRTPTATPTATPTRTVPSPTPSRSGTVGPTPASPLTTSIGAVRCPSRSVTVEVTNRSRQAVDYSIEQDGTPTVADRIGAGATRTSRLTLKEDDRTTIAVVWTNRTLRSVRRTANCAHRAAPAPAPSPRRNLPHTGPDSAAVVAKVATGVASMITGVVVFWYGGIWPRRRDQVLRVRK
ncbi:MAG TPA: hypothetical protein VFU43_19050 [Streptosporangiaceae bacterium]|nr:hypothetical protein [Streptosporangiaceae bacterium]